MHLRFAFLLFVSFALWGTEPGIHMTLDHAITYEERAWGLMGRHQLPENYGMLFHLKRRTTNFWMFNCFLDMSVAFIDKDNVIISISDLKSYPEKMDPKRPIKSLSDIFLYPPNDPAIIFFRQNIVASPPSAHFALETSRDWFQKNEIKPGDKMTWNADKATFYKSHSSRK